MVEIKWGFSLNPPKVVHFLLGGRSATKTPALNSAKSADVAFVAVRHRHVCGLDRPGRSGGDGGARGVWKILMVETLGNQPLRDGFLWDADVLCG